MPRLIPRPLVGLVAAIGLIAALVTVVPRPAAGTTPPSIVLILTDDQRSDTLGNMPKLKNQLVAHGVKFTNGFVVNSLCCPSRSSILKGQYSHTTGVYGNEGSDGAEAFDDSSTIATALHGAGYHTAIFGKYLNGYTGTSIPPGWDRWDVFQMPVNSYYKYWVNDQGTLKYYGTATSDYSTDMLGGKAVSFIKNTTGPLFMVYAPKAPHGPATPPSRYSTNFSSIAAYRPPSYNESDVSDKPAWVRALPRLTDSRRRSLDNFRKNQYRTLLAVDDQVGNIISALSSTGRLSNTLIMYASDNGLSWGEHRWVQRKEAPYEEDIRVPLIIRYDPLTGTARTDGHLVLNIDWAPTFAALAGVSIPAPEGVSLLPLLSGSPQPWRSDFLVEHRLGTAKPDPPSFCEVRNGGYSYISYSTGEQELYDLAADPYQQSNKAGNAAYATIKTNMQQRLAELCSPPPPGVTPSLLQTATGKQLPTPTHRSRPPEDDTSVASD